MVVYLPQAIKRYLKSNDGARLAVVRLGVVFIFFSTSSTILPTYIYPLYPLAAVLVGALWAAWMNGEEGIERGIRPGLQVGVILGVIFGLIIVKLTAPFLSPYWQAAILGSLLALPGIYSLRWGWSSTPRLRFAWHRLRWAWCCLRAAWRRLFCP